MVSKAAADTCKRPMIRLRAFCFTFAVICLVLVTNTKSKNKALLPTVWSPLELDSQPLYWIWLALISAAIISDTCCSLFLARNCEVLSFFMSIAFATLFQSQCTSPVSEPTIAVRQILPSLTLTTAGLWGNAASTALSSGLIIEGALATCLLSLEEPGWTASSCLLASGASAVVGGNATAVAGGNATAVVGGNATAWSKSQLCILAGPALASIAGSGKNAGSGGLGNALELEVSNGKSTWLGNALSWWMAGPWTSNQEVGQVLGCAPTTTCEGNGTPCNSHALVPNIPPMPAAKPLLDSKLFTIASSGWQVGVGTPCDISGCILLVSKPQLGCGSGNELFWCWEPGKGWCKHELAFGLLPSSPKPMCCTLAKVSSPKLCVDMMSCPIPGGTVLASKL